MSLFAPFEPDAERLPRSRARLRAAEEGDLEGVARLCHERSGGELQRHLRSFRGSFAEGVEQLFVAEEGRALVAYAKCAPLAIPAEAPPEAIPGGWYLTGVVVAPAQRRRGLALALTQLRLDWLAQRTELVRSFASAQNPVSLALHARSGFEEERRNIWAPRVSFTGGVGVLFRRAL